MSRIAQLEQRLEEVVSLLKAGPSGSTGQLPRASHNDVVLLAERPGTDGSCGLDLISSSNTRNRMIAVHDGAALTPPQPDSTPDA